MEAHEAFQRTWLLAHQLSISYGASRSCRTTVSQLCNIFPGIKHFSLAVLSTDGCMVSSTSKTQAGPRSVCLHLEGTSCVGMVATKGWALQASLSGPAGALLSKLSDIQAMIKDTETSSPISHILCMPIQPSSPSSTGVKGALLLGFSSPPDLSPRRAAGVAALCTMLSERLAHSSPAVICHVETMIGRHLGCPCCVPDSDDEMDLENDDINSDSCGGDGDKGPGRKDRGTPPHQLLLIPIEEGEEEGEGQHSGGESSGNSSPRSLRGKGGKASGDHLEKENWMKTTTTAIPPVVPAPSSLIVTPRPGYTFSKAVTASVTRECLGARHPLTLSYADSALETEFANWFQDRLKPVDLLFSCLVVISMVLLAYCRSYTATGTQEVVGETAWSNFVALPLLLPVFMSLFCSFQLHQRLRETIVAVVRLYLVVAASKSAVSQLQAAQQQHLGMSTTTATETTASFLACWIASGGETLFTPAFGFQMRMKWHLPLQTAAVAVMCYNVQNICGPSYHSMGFLPESGIVNYLCTVAAAGVVGFVVPTMLLRASEVKSRQQFEAQIGAAAGIST